MICSELSSQLRVTMTTTLFPDACVLLFFFLLASVSVWSITASNTSYMALQKGDITVKTAITNEPNETEGKGTGALFGRAHV